MEFLNSEATDFDEIFRLYDLAIDFQKSKFDKFWLPFDRPMIEREIAEKRHWKILIDQKIACIYSIAFDELLEIEEIIAPNQICIKGKSDFSVKITFSSRGRIYYFLARMVINEYNLKNQRINLLMLSDW